MAAPLVMLVDDHTDSRETHALFLRRSGFSVVEAADGSTALIQAAAGPLPSIVVTSGLR
jgi:CheY-like chemotaxis protein